MITEDYVSFEVAKLLREKGFSELTAKAYPYFEGKDYKYDISCPTLQMAMKWLREAYNLVIQIELIDFLEHGEVWLYCITERKTIKQLTGRDDDFTEHSYKQACESAIKYCLEHLI